MTGRKWKEEKKTIAGLFFSVIIGMLLIPMIWKNDYTQNSPFGILDAGDSGQEN